MRRIVQLVPSVLYAVRSRTEILPALIRPSEKAMKGRRQQRDIQRWDGERRAVGRVRESRASEGAGQAGLLLFFRGT